MKQKKKISPTLILVIMLISMTSGAICMNKVAPVLTNIMSDLQISSSARAGLLMSVFTLAGIFLSIPMGVLVTKFGTFKTGLGSLLAIIAGCILGAVATDYNMMLVSRVIEGIGLMFLGTIGPAAVAQSYSDRKRGVAMGILMCYMSFGQILALNIAPVFATISSWKNFWWMNAAVGMVALVLWVIFIKEFDNQTSDLGSVSENAEQNPSIWDVMKNGSVWLVCIEFVCYMIVHMGVFNYLPTYLTEVAGMSATYAGTLTSVASLIGIPVGILGGMLADKWGSIKKPLAIMMILFALLIFCTPIFSGSAFVLYIILYGVLAMAEAGLSFTAVTIVVRSEESGLASAFMNTAQWVGAFLSTMIFGALLDSFGWSMSFRIMAPIALIGGIAVLLNKKLN